jgi:hypothetical protein
VESVEYSLPNKHYFEIGELERSESAKQVMAKLTCSQI